MHLNSNPPNASGVQFHILFVTICSLYCSRKTRIFGPGRLITWCQKRDTDSMQYREYTYCPEHLEHDGTTIICIQFQEKATGFT